MKSGCAVSGSVVTLVAVTEDDEAKGRVEGASCRLEEDDVLEVVANCIVAMNSLLEPGGMFTRRTVMLDTRMLPGDPAGTELVRPVLRFVALDGRIISSLLLFFTIFFCFALFKGRVREQLRGANHVQTFKNWFPPAPLDLRLRAGGGF